MRNLALMTLIGVVLTSNTAFASLLNLGPEQLVQADGSDIEVAGYSVPSYVDWNNDGRMDLLVGEGPNASWQGKIQVYLNTGTASAPQFPNFFYAQSGGGDLAVPASGCLGSYPRAVYWDEDGRKDLLVGLADGTVKIYLNTGTDASPTFDAGTMLQVGPSGSEVNIDVGSRANPVAVDWNNDGLKDLAVGALDGKLHLFLNSGTDPAPDFLAQTFAQNGGSDLVVPSSRLSPYIGDLDGDGNKDLLAGNTNGQLLLYSNTGTDAAPSFSGYLLVDSDGVAIDLLGYSRSRPFVCDWTGDGYLDVLIGAADGQVHLYEGVPEPVTVLLLGLGGLTLLKRRRS
jgi:WD40 repeat protein